MLEVRAGGSGCPLRYLVHGEGTPLWPGFLAKFEQRAEGIDRARLLAGIQSAFKQFRRAAAHELLALAPAQP